MNNFISTGWLLLQIDKVFFSGVKGFLVTIFLFLTKLIGWIEPYFFGRDFLVILTILMMSDMAVGIGKHIKLKDFHFKMMFNKFAFKLMTVAVATVSAKAIMSIDHTLNSGILIVAVKMTIALYLFGNIEKNICQLTEGKLCFYWLIDRIKSLFPFLKKSKEDEGDNNSKEQLPG